MLCFCRGFFTMSSSSKAATLSMERHSFIVLAAQVVLSGALREKREAAQKKRKEKKNAELGSL